MILYLRITAISAGFILAIAGCGKGVCLQGSGAVTTEARTITGFTKIHLYNRVNLILTQDTIESIRIEAGKHLLAGIETSVQNDTLTIKDNNTCNWVRDLDNQINVYVHVKLLDHIKYYGSGNVSSTNALTGETILFESWDGMGSFHVTVQTDYTRIHSWRNNADFTLEGQTGSLYVFCVDQGKVDCSKLSCPVARIDHRSIYDMYINCKESLYTDLWWKGNLYVSGNPAQVDVKTHDAGRLITLP